MCYFHQLCTCGCVLARACPHPYATRVLLGGIPFCFVMNAAEVNRAQVSNLFYCLAFVRSREKIKNLCLSVDCSRGSANAQNRRADSGRYFYVQRARVYLCTKKSWIFLVHKYIYTKSACIFVYQKKSWIFLKLDFWAGFSE